MPESKRVIPLESNPEIFNALGHKIGLSPVLLFQDVYSITDPDLLAFLPQPVMALVMLFPITKQYEEYRKDEDAKNGNSRDGALWFRQTIGNGCGLYALLHVLANLPREFIVKDLVVNNVLLLQLDGASDAEIAQLVELLEQNIQLDSNYGTQGQTEAPPAENSIETHFITYVKGSDDHVYELDGRRTGPVDLGLSSGSKHLLDEKKVVDKIQFYMENTDESQKNNFALMAVAPAL